MKAVEWISPACHAWYVQEAARCGSTALEFIEHDSKAPAWFKCADLASQYARYAAGYAFLAYPELRPDGEAA